MEGGNSPVLGDSVKQPGDLALRTRQVAPNSAEGRLLLARTQNRAVVGLPQRTLAPSFILCQMFSEGQVHARLPAGHQGVKEGWNEAFTQKDPQSGQEDACLKNCNVT